MPDIKYCICYADLSEQGRPATKGGRALAHQEIFTSRAAAEETIWEIYLLSPDPTDNWLHVVSEEEDLDLTLGEKYESLTGRPHKIGVFDYESLCALIRHEHKRLLPENTTADPQGQIQEIVGLCMELRRQSEFAVRLAAQ